MFKPSTNKGEINMTFQECVEKLLQDIGSDEIARREKAFKEFKEQQRKYKHKHEDTPRYTLDGLKYYR